MSSTKPGTATARKKKRVVWFKQETTPPPMERAFKEEVEDDTDPTSPAWALVRELAEAERWLAAGNGSKELREIYKRGFLKTSLELYRQERRSAVAPKKTRR